MNDPNGLPHDQLHGNDPLLRRRNSTCWNRRWVRKSGSKVITSAAALHCVFLILGAGVVGAAQKIPAGPEAVSSTPEASGRVRAAANSVRTVVKQDGSCHSPGCHREASRIRDFMDETVDPCDNFYQFACGGFINSTIIQDNHTQSTMFTILQDTINKQVNTMMESESNGRSKERKAFGLVKKMYKSCMNTTAIENEGVKPLKKLLEKWGGWPILDADRWNDSNTDGLIYRSVIECDIDKEINNYTGISLNLTRTTNYFISAQNLREGFDNEMVQSYYALMIDIAVSLGADRDRASTELKKVVQFEMDRAKIAVEEEKNISETSNTMTVGELAKNYSSLPWKAYFAYPSDPLHYNTSAYNYVGDNDVVVVSSPRYLDGLAQLMNTTAKEVLANYAMWRLTQPLLLFLNDDVRKRFSATLNAIFEPTTRESRRKECFAMVNRMFPRSLDAMYVTEHLHREAKNNVDEMVMVIKSQFKEMWKQMDWMDDSARKKAIEKLEAMSADIAYPYELLDDVKIDEFYEELELSEDNYFENICNLVEFKAARMYRKYRQPGGENPLETETLETQAIADAMYEHWYNRFILPAGMLQGVFFGDDRPRYMNYAAIGHVIGHEISHGFHDRKEKIDKKGNVADWWNPLTKEKFLEKIECIIEQYGNYTFKEIGLKVNGSITRNENFADNWAVQVAYFAYHNWTEKNGPELKLADLDYTPDQIFWISYAQCSCSKNTLDSAKLIIQDFHSPPEQRVIGPLSNFPEFSKDFNCPIGSRMNPVKKCTLG